MPAIAYDYCNNYEMYYMLIPHFIVKEFETLRATSSWQIQPTDFLILNPIYFHLFNLSSHVTKYMLIIPSYQLSN